MKIAVIILNYNSSSDCKNCISFLEKQEDVDLEIVIVDNASKPEDQEELRKLEELWKDEKVSTLNPSKGDFWNDGEFWENRGKTGTIKNLTLIEAKENRGYNAGNNIGLRYAAEKGYQWALIANPDMEFPDPFYLKKLLKFVESSESPNSTNSSNFNNSFNSPNSPNSPNSHNSHNFNNSTNSPNSPNSPTSPNSPDFSTSSNFIKKDIVAIGTDIVTPEGIHQNPKFRGNEDWKRSFDWVKGYFSKKNISPDTPDWVVNPKVSGECRCLNGCCVLVNLNFLNQIGYFDERTFLYGEEPIFGRQVELANKKMYYFAGATAIHNHKKSQEGSSSFCRKHWRNSQIIYIRNYSKQPFYGRWIAELSSRLYFFALNLNSFLRK